MINSCPQWDLNHLTFHKAKSLSVVLLDDIFIEHLNVDRVLPECSI